MAYYGFNHAANPSVSSCSVPPAAEFCLAAMRHQHHPAAAPLPPPCNTADMAQGMLANRQMALSSDMGSTSTAALLTAMHQRHGATLPVQSHSPIEHLCAKTACHAPPAQFGSAATAATSAIERQGCGDGGICGQTQAEAWLAQMRARHADVSTPAFPGQTGLENQAVSMSAALQPSIAQESAPSPGATHRDQILAEAVQQMAAELEKERAKVNIERERLLEERRSIREQQTVLAKERSALRKKQADSKPIVQPEIPAAAEITNPRAPTSLVAEQPHDAADGACLNLLEHGAWLAETLGLAHQQHGASASIQANDEGAQAVSPRHPMVFVNVDRVWPGVYTELPKPGFGSGSHLSRRYGLLLGRRRAACSMAGSTPQPIASLELETARLFPEPFSWQPSDSSQEADGTRNPSLGRDHIGHVGRRAAELAEELDSSVQKFLAEKFGPWALQQAREVEGGAKGGTVDSLAETAVAWLICSDGEAFGLSTPELQLPQILKDESWASTVVVFDTAKSSAADAAFEVFALQPNGVFLESCGSRPERLVYDVKSPQGSSGGRP